MEHSAVARRYARALFEVARSQGRVAEVGQELGLATELLTGQRELRALWEHEEVSERVKLDVVARAVAPRVSPVIKSFLSLLAVKRREKVLPLILREYTALSQTAMGVVEVEVRSAAPLNTETLAALEANLAQRLGAKKVELSASVDQTLVGGLAVRVGDLLFDGSVRGRLQRLRSRLVRGSAS